MSKHTITISLSLLFYIASSLPKNTNTIAITDSLCDGETLVSANGAFTLGFFSPQNGSDNRYLGTWHTKVSTQTVIWVANRNTPIIYSPATLYITMTGTLIIADNDGSIIWTSGSEPITDPIAQLLDTGNFVIRQSNVSSNNNSVPFAWQSFDHPTDTLLPGMKLGLDLKTGLNRTLTSWASPTDPSSGSYTLSMDIQGYPQIFLGSGFAWEWRSGPWNGLGFSGIPEMSTTNMTTSTFVNNYNEVYSMYNMHDPLVITRLTLNPKGSVERLVWVQSSKSWNVFWSAPRDRCDKSPCGQFGVCDIDEFPICDCLPGFKPRVHERWVQKDNSDGCVRKTELDCRNGTDGFMKLSMAKLPDTSRAVVNLSLGLDDCKAACLKNCSCNAYSSANISGGGSGCIIWVTELIDVRVYGFGGQDLYVRVASADLADLDAKTDNSARSHNTATIIALTAVLFVLLSSILVWTGHYVRKNKKKGNVAIRTTSRGSIALSDLYSHESPENEDLELPMFDFCTIAAATSNFSVNNQLGEGGFGPVYKGTLGGQTVAIKRLAKSSSQGIVEFKNEILVIARLQHRNLVRLLGCCIEGDERMLIYEYLPNKSLDLFLFDDTKSRLLDWETRYNIIMGIARGMLYLHQDSRFRIIHRDLKASNILLDNDLKPKISDFGMARIFKGDGIDINTNKIVGTYGYMSPEYAMDGVLSVKSDVFSFGVLVLEIISGRKNRGIYLSKPSVNLLAMTWRLWREGNGLHLVDESVGYCVPMAQVLRCIKVGLLCVQEWAEDRPTMSSVVLMLSSNDNSLLLPDPKQPAFVSGRIALEDPSSCNMSSTTTRTSSSVTGSNHHSSSGTDYTC